jgi:hypothetical protein
MHFIPCTKTYVTPEQIVFHENAIFVQVNGMVMQTQSISVDEQGIFFADARDGDCGAMQWKCVKPIVPGIPCDRCNWIWHSWCTNCGKSR